MKILPGIGLSAVQNVYAGPEGYLWELDMSQQIHVGGFASSLELAEKAGIGAGGRGVDLCCCNGAGMRFLIRFRNVAHMTGVDATAKMLARGRERCAAEGMAGRTARRNGSGHQNISTLLELVAVILSSGSLKRGPRNAGMAHVFRVATPWPAPCAVFCSCRSGAGACRGPPGSCPLASGRRSARCLPLSPAPRPSAHCQTSGGN